jgi:hypothetical protein
LYRRIVDVLLLHHGLEGAHDPPNEFPPLNMLLDAGNQALLTIPSTPSKASSRIDRWHRFSGDARQHFSMWPSRLASSGDHHRATAEDAKLVARTGYRLKLPRLASSKETAVPLTG